MASLPQRTNYPRLPLFLGVVVITIAVIWLLALDSDRREVALPMIAVIATVIALLAVLWQRDGAPPYVDLGLTCVVVTAIYLAYPLIALLASGLTWSELSDNRLTAFQATPALFAKVGWWGAIYLACLAAAYALVRGQRAVTYTTPLEEPGRTATIVTVASYTIVLLYTQLVQIVFDIDLNPSYGSELQAVRSLPLWIEQVTGKMLGIGVVLQVALILLLVNRSDEAIWQWVLWAWAAVLVVTLLTVFGSRSSVVFFVFIWLLAHQRLRRPLSPVALAGVGVSLLAAVLLYGFARDIGEMGQESDAFSAANEFQALYATAYHILLMRDAGMLADAPWQLYIADFIRPIPQQLLPFDKVDPGEWYLDLLGLRGQGVGFMFGVVSEAAVGFGALEIAVRGMIVGAVLALIHNWYARNAARFWPTVFYLWLCVWSYYTYRASSFYLLGHVLTMFLPIYLFINAFEPRQSRAMRTLGAGGRPR